MSKTIDQRVVEMRFDNKQFESNVSNTMSTIEKLKQSLRFKGATEGFQDISTAANKVNMTGLGGAVDAIHAKFSALQVMGVTALANITNSAVNAGKRIVSALTIDPIKTGFQEYETQINAVQTILANTQSKGTTLKDVNKALDTLNTYADKTIYNFTEMTRNIGTFTAAGVDLDTSVKSIQGIANLAAISGSTSQQASTAMYQLSQALAAGRVSLMDWNSVVNAGMGGQVFQDALKRTAENMGKDVDGMIEKFGSFRESLTQGEWLTAEVLTKTLEQFTMAAEEGTDEWNNFKKSLMDEGYTAEQAEEILKMANTATDAATKVKTFTQLWDTLKEAVQSGWTQTWEILIGDFEEAKELLTTISDIAGEMINNSAKARNELLQGWKDAGGRSDMLEGFKNIFNSLMDIITPIKEAFVDMFPPLTVDHLVNFTKGFKNLTKTFEEFTSAHGEQIYDTFHGIFSIVKVGFNIIKQLGSGVVQVISHFTGLGGGILGITAAIGNWLGSLGESINKSDILGKSIDGVAGFIGKAIDKLKEFGSAIKESLSPNGMEGFATAFQAVWDIIRKVGSEIGKVFSALGDALSQAFGGSYLDSVINTGMLTGIAMMIKKFMDTLGDALGEGTGFFENVKGILDDVRGSFEAYQNSLNAETLKKIATAIAILAASIFLISTIDPGKLASSLGAITIMFGELMAALAIFTKISKAGIKGVMTAVPLMIGMSTAILMLSLALKSISSIPTEKIAGSLVAIGVLMAELAIFLNTAKFDGKIGRTAIGIALLGGALVILAEAAKSFASMSWGEIGKGLTSIGALLLGLSVFTNLTGNAKHVISTGVAMTLLAAAMKTFASAIADFAGLEWGELGRGIAGMAVALIAIGVAMRLMPTGTVALGVGLIAVAASLKVMASALSDFGGMTWDEIGRGLTVMGVALAEMAIALNLMNGTLAGSAALIVAAGALAIIAPVMKTLGGMTWGNIAKGLVTLAGAFAVIGIAGLLLSPIIPAILALSGAFALLGISVLGIGAGLALAGIGLTAIAAGLTALAGAAAAGATAIVAAITIIVTGVIDLIPTITSKIGEAILAICSVISDCAPQIAESLLTLVAEVLSAGATYIPQIVDSLMTLLIGVLESLATRIPELVSVAIEVIAAFFQGVIDALSGFSFESLVKTIGGIGLMAGLMAALSAIVGMIPGAMAGVIGMGVVIAELALVLAAVGAFAQIPGLSWLIGEGGNLLQQIGTAIGQFVGGIAGGIAEGATSTLPQIGTSLSNFMTNLQPFIDGAKNLDASMLEGVRALAETILIITAADLLNGITSWITGGDSLTRFAAQLVPFGQSMRLYSQAVAGLDAGAVASSAVAAKALSELANNLPNSGGVVSWFTGDNTLADFATQLIPFGKAMKEYSMAVSGIDAASISVSVVAAKGIAKLAEAIPNSGGIAGLFSGDNDLSSFAKELVPFGKNLKKYADSVSGIDAGGVNNAVSVVKKLKSMINSLSGIDTSGVESFKSALSSLAKVNIDGVVKAFSGSSGSFTSIGTNLISALAKGIVSGKATAVAAANSVIADVVKTLTTKQNEFQKIGQTIMTKFVTGISKQKAKATSAIGTVISAAVNKARSYYNSFYSAGSYVVTGFANGISANSFRASAKAAAMAQAALNAAKRALDERSPSKESRKLGVWFGEGFVYGIVDMFRAVRSTSSKMATTAIDSFNGAISKANDMLSFDFDTQPTIRPIVDLSDITAGANRITDMLSLTPSVGVLANVGAVSTMMNRRNQNGINDDVVNAIEKLRGDVGGLRGGDSYTIGNITYDDGSAIAQAIQTIIRYVKIEGRV